METSSQQVPSTTTSQSPGDNDKSSSSIPDNNQNQNNSTSFQATATWTRAHLETCLALKSFSATPQQVLVHVQKDKGQKSTLLLPLAHQVVVLEQNQMDESLVKVGASIAGYYKQQQKEQEDTVKQDNHTTSWRSLVTNKVSSSFGYIWNKISNVDEEMDMGDDLEEDDAQATWDDETPKDQDVLQQEVGWTDHVIHLELAMQCCKELIQYSSRQQEESILFLHLNENNNHVSSLKSWCRQVGQECSSDCRSRPILENIHDKHAMLMAHALISLHKAQFVTLDDSTRVLAVFTTDQAPNNEQIKIQTAIYQMDLAIQQTEQRIELYETKAKQAGQRAVALKNNTHKSKLLLELRKHKMYQQQVDQSHAALLQLETVRMALDQAQTQAQVVASLSQTSAALQKLQSIDVNRVDDVMDDLQEQLDMVQQETTSSVLPVLNVEEEEEELWKELEALSLEPTEPFNNKTNVKDAAPHHCDVDKRHKELDALASNNNNVDNDRTDSEALSETEETKNRATESNTTQTDKRQAVGTVMD